MDLKDLRPKEEKTGSRLRTEEDRQKELRDAHIVGFEAFYGICWQ